MKSTSFLILIVFGLLVAAVMLTSGGAVEKTHKLTSISPRKMTDALHAVIAADRETYARVIVQRLVFEKGSLKASENWHDAECLPVHAQMLRLAGASVQRKGAEFSYSLRSLWPINENHGPQTAAEKAGLEQVAKNPVANYYTDETLGGRSYFTAIYPDVASLTSCADCHNRHPASPRRDFKPNDVMGAIVVRIPLEF